MPSQYAAVAARTLTEVNEHLFASDREDAEAHPLAVTFKELKMMKFGIILEEAHIDDWQYQIIRDTQKDSSVLELVLELAVATRASKNRKSSLSNLLYGAWEKSQPKSVAPARVNFLSSPAAANALLLQCGAAGTDAQPSLIDDETAEKIRSCGLDFILYFGTEALTGPILQAARFGVWAFQYGSEKKHRRYPTCFWEMYSHETEIEGTLQRLTEKPGSGIVLQRFSVPNHKYSLARNLHAIREASIPMVRSAIVDIRNGASCPHDAVADEHAAAPTLPTNIEMARFLVLVTMNLIKHVMRRAFFSHHWQMAITSASVDEVMAQGIKTSSLVKRGKIHEYFYADPFIFAESEGAISILAEQYDWKTDKGIIVKIDAPIQGNDIGREQSHSILEMPVHLAYPSLIRTEDKTYLLPEAKKSRRIALHEIDDSGAILNSTTIVDNVELNDPTIVFHNAKYWLFASNQKGELYIWHSHSLTEGWQPHAKQPVLISPSRSRAAGAMFRHNDQLVRPTQDCSEDYGQQVIFNKITVLDESSFSQELIGHIPPVTNGVAYGGLHTFNIGKRHIIFDLRTWHLDLLKPARVIFKTIRKRLGRKSILSDKNMPRPAETSFRSSGEASAALNKS